MADSPENKQETQDAAAPPAKGGKKMLIIIVLIALLAGGGGYYFFFVRARTATATDKTKEKADKKKKGASAEEESEAADSEKKSDDEKKSAPENANSKKLLEISVPDDGEVKQVVELQPFIVNLADDSEPRYLRMTVSLGLAEATEAKPDPIFTTKVRNAMLAILTSKKSDEILTVEGKATLRKELLKAAQTAVSEPEVHAIYITDFIIQL